MNNVPLSLSALCLPVDTNQPMAFYRARSFAADPPILEIWRPENGVPMWVLYGQPGAAYLVEPSEEAAGARLAGSGIRLKLTNSFAVLGPAANAAALPPFRVRKE